MPSDPITLVYERVAELTIRHSSIKELTGRNQPAFVNSDKVVVGGGIHPQLKDPSPGAPRLLMYPATSELQRQDGNTCRLLLSFEVAIDSAAVMLDAEVFPIQWALLARLKELGNELTSYNPTGLLRVDHVIVNAITASLEDVASGKHLGWSCVHRITVQCSM